MQPQDGGPTGEAGLQRERRLAQTAFPGPRYISIRHCHRGILMLLCASLSGVKSHLPSNS